LVSVAQLRRFLEGSTEVQFQPCGEDAQRYAFMSLSEFLCVSVR
jgi:hypothetical protein